MLHVLTLRNFLCFTQGSILGQQLVIMFILMTFVNLTSVQVYLLMTQIYYVVIET